MSDDAIAVDNPECLVIALSCSTLWDDTDDEWDEAEVIHMFDEQANCFLEN